MRSLSSIGQVTVFSLATVAQAMLLAANVVADPVRPELMNASVDRQVCLACQQSPVSVVGSLPNIASHPDLSLDLSSASVGAYDRQSESTMAPILLDDPICMKNCQVPEPGSLILLATAWLGLGMKRRYAHIAKGQSH